MAQISVAAMKPFFRYCVIYEAGIGCRPALPFYTLKGAVKFAMVLQESGAFAGTRLLVFRKLRRGELDPTPVVVFEGALLIAVHECPSCKFPVREDEGHCVAGQWLHEQCLGMTSS